MHRLLLFFLPIIFLNADCTQNKSRDEKRRDLMEKAVVALKTYDTVQLFQILDTGEIFTFWGRELVMFEVDYVNERFKTCSSALPDSIAERRIYNLPAIEYILPFGRDSLGRVVSTSFDLVFRFADYVDDNKIIGMKVEKYRLKVDSPKILPPIPVPQN